MKDKIKPRNFFGYIIRTADIRKKSVKAIQLNGVIDFIQ